MHVRHPSMASSPFWASLPYGIGYAPYVPFTDKSWGHSWRRGWGGLVATSLSLSYPKLKVRYRPLTVKRTRRAGCNMSFHLERRAPTAPPPLRGETCTHIKENQKCERDKKSNRKYKRKNGKLYVAALCLQGGRTTNHLKWEPQAEK